MDEATLILISAALIFTIYLLRKVRLLRDLLILFVFLALFLAVMAAVPQLRIQPIYDLLRQLFERLPDWIGETLNLLKRMLGGLPP